MPKAVLDNDITVTCKYPIIETDFNPDAYVGNEYPLVLKLVHIGSSRNMTLSFPTVQLLDYKEIEIGSELGIEMTLRQTSNLTITTE
jgi:hypothetical protein